LHETQDRQDDGTPDADAFIGGHEGDQEGRNPHQHQGRNQRCLAADTVAVMAEDRRADGPRHKTNGVNGEGFERSHQGVGMGKKQLGENQAGDGAVEEEIIPLDRRADGAGDDGPAQLNAVFVFAETANDSLGHHAPPCCPARLPIV
jgi:hypothetical protein